MTRRSVVTVLGTLLLLLVLSVTPVAGAASSANNPSGGAKHSTIKTAATTAQVFGVVFFGPFESHHFSITASGGNKLVASTEDGGIPGDHWGSFLSDNVGGSTAGAADHAKGNCGNGSITAYTGPVSLGSTSKPFTGTARLQIVYCSGVDAFTAGMNVKISYNGPNLAVTVDT